MTKLSTARPVARIAGGAMVALALTVGLAACSGGSPAPSATPTTSTAKPAQTVYGKCVDGAIQVTAKADVPDPVQVPSCAGVNLITSDATYELDAVQVLTVEASNTKVAIKGAGTTTIALLGSGNTVTYVGDAPTVDDQGEGNSVTAG